MSKMYTERVRNALHGPTMGARWSALFFAPATVDPDPIRAALQAAVDEVDAQMSTWKPDSDLMRLDAAPLGEWTAVPARLGQVLRLGLEIGRASGGAFDIGMGDAVTAWGFGPATAAPDRIRAAMARTRLPAHAALEIDGDRVRKIAPVALDLNGIAKGYGVDRLAETIRDHGIGDGLVGIDGEMRALGLRPDGQAWTIAIEAPDAERRTLRSVVALENAAVATSGDYRHRVEVGRRRLSHTMDPNRGAPLAASPASVTVLARTCAEADAWATALMVLGPDEGAALARTRGLDALFLLRSKGGDCRAVGVGDVFAPLPEASSPDAKRQAWPARAEHMTGLLE
ncbi:FAD:protein FMN transferase [Jannaschia rubra]|uniref:FAD:protein FMN transferase n=1 Tax=Jannaschia rubra TaxID=282197 RepID=A0A0M6XUR6_9RHOB|nr:FAD:protein FMN transferase [Jannaschia rubra]CTQ34003.1 Thiamine biosynthesis lipoprotein ApbE precursor [Jannaschia rubra]SFG25401.1 thiamine biosynthesis lipoprotein [Jannaschia rubra]